MQFEVVANGDFCRRFMATTEVYISDLKGGVEREFGEHYWSILSKLEISIIDGTIVRAHPCAAGYGKDSQAQEALGRNKGGFTTKIHACVLEIH